MSEHLCGLQGFGRGADGINDRCPACEESHEAYLARVVSRPAASARDGEARDRRFPILDGEDIPWRAIARHEDIAKANHGGQDLEHLASRGGLSVREAIHVIERRRWRGPESDAIVQLSDAAAADRLRGLLSERDGETLSDERAFEYLLNAMELAGQAPTPALEGYGEKRKAVLAFVATLRGELAEAGKQRDMMLRKADELLCENILLRDLVHEVAVSGVESDLSPRYLTVQIDCETWRELQATRAARSGSARGATQ